MRRSASPQDLVQLPAFTPSELVSVVGKLLAEAKNHPPLPQPIERARERLAQELTTLRSANRAESRAERRRADEALDRAWKAVHLWLGGWCALDTDHPEARAARDLFGMLFPRELAFTRLPFRHEWAESKARIEAIERSGHEATFVALGGALFLSHLRAAQIRYGEVLNLDDCDVEPLTGHDFDAAGAALRRYVVRVTSHADPEVPGSEALAQALLAPLLSPA